MKQITCPHCGDTYPDFDVAHVCSRGPYAPRFKPKMNERIQELMAEVGMSVDYLTNTKQIVLIEKFAELIVRECAEVAHCNFHVDGVTLGNIMKERFGVKE